MATRINRSAIYRVILKNMKEFRRRGAMTVRPGYKITGGWITDKPAIVVTVDKKLDNLPARDMVPFEVDNIPTDVREATGLQRVRATDPDAFALAATHMRPEFKEPEWSDECTVKDGQPVAKGQAETKARAVRSRQAAKPQIPYTPPKGQPLTAVTRDMTILACASPDDGFSLLKQFLAQVKAELTIGMYDFTSGDILAEVIGALKPKRLPLEMVLDHPPRNETANQTDDVTREDILKADSRAKINWALTRNDPVATKWIFPSAYHIKVAVRDGTCFWLSSGNFNVSNEPNFAANDPKRGTPTKADRDWHVVVLDKGLAELYKAYIENDFTVAAQGQSKGDPQLHNQIHSAMNKLAAQQKRSSQSLAARLRAKPSTLGKQRVFTNAPVTVQPLLTPDKGQNGTLYVDKILNLINSAKRSVFMQTQYVHPSDRPADKDFQLLVEALSNAFRRGLDVRLITSQFENTPQWLEKLKPFNLDQILRIQNRVHNKGIVVDSHITLVSSQNWSGDGTLRNRDAGLIIDNADIAAYFEAIFIDDWTQRANQKIVDASSAAPKASKKATRKPADRRKKKRKAPAPARRRSVRG